jgi:hypothetical protein
VSAEGRHRSRVGSDAGSPPRVARLRIRFAPIAWLAGAGFTGYGIDEFVGAGIALMLPATVVFVGALLDPAEPSVSRVNPRKGKTLRHRWFLWLDQLGRKLEHRKQLRRERQGAEQRYLDSRRKREERRR